MQFDNVFERTDSGVAEIHQKSNRLTQSERLVLIMTDGRTDVATLIEKMPSLSMPRVFRALAKLQDLGLMTQQIVAPVGLGNANDAIAPEVVERFLEQTDLDPATIIRSDADDFSPTTLPSGMSLQDPTRPPRDDTELERRLKALMGETPKFAREDAPTRSAAMPTPAPVTDVAPEEVVRAARQAAMLPAAPVITPPPPPVQHTTRSVPVQKPDFAASQRLPRVTQRVPVQPPPPQPRQSWMLYALMAVGAALVAYALLRVVMR
ncbi:MAG: hypothetical protein RL341_98 [Pseudomonadota bacterium]|jgi:hypothetical protein